MNEFNYTAAKDNADTWSSDMFGSWFESPLLCPPLLEDIVLNGTDAHMTSNFLIFQILKCNNETLDEGQAPCKPIEEVNKFINRLQVDTWTEQDNVETTIFGASPI